MSVYTELKATAPQSWYVMVNEIGSKTGSFTSGSAIAVLNGYKMTQLLDLIFEMANYLASMRPLLTALFYF